MPVENVTSSIGFTLLTPRKYSAVLAAWKTMTLRTVGGWPHWMDQSFAGSACGIDRRLRLLSAFRSWSHLHCCWTTVNLNRFSQWPLGKWLSESVSKQVSKWYLISRSTHSRLLWRHIWYHWIIALETTVCTSIHKTGCWNCRLCLWNYKYLLSLMFNDLNKMAI